MVECTDENITCDNVYCSDLVNQPVLDTYSYSVEWNKQARLPYGTCLKVNCTPFILPAPHYTVHHTASHHTTPHYTTPHCTTPHHTTPSHHTPPHLPGIELSNVGIHYCTNAAIVGRIETLPTSWNCPCMYDHWRVSNSIVLLLCVCVRCLAQRHAPLLSLCHSFIHYHVIAATPLTTPQHTWPLILPTCQTMYTTLHHFRSIINIHGTVIEHDSNTVHCFVSSPAHSSHRITMPMQHTTSQVIMHTYGPHCTNLLHMRAPMYEYIPETDGRSQYSLLDSAYAGFLCIATAPAPTPSLWRPMEWEVSMN